MVKFAPLRTFCGLGRLSRAARAIFPLEYLVQPTKVHTACSQCDTALRTAGLI